MPKPAPSSSITINDPPKGRRHRRADGASGGQGSSQGAAPSPKAQPRKSAEDVALIYGKTEDGGVNVLRKRKDSLEAGVLRPLQEGKPIDGEVVQLHQRGKSPVFDVEVHVAGPKRQAAPAELSKGPPQVASGSYRKGWDQIYRSKSGSKRGTSKPNKLLN